jgi:hypothetical protein
VASTNVRKAAREKEMELKCWTGKKEEIRGGERVGGVDGYLSSALLLVLLLLLLLLRPRVGFVGDAGPALPKLGLDRREPVPLGL